MASPDLSCIIPARNAELYIGEAIRSVLDQTVPPDEIVVVDDGSIDGTGREVAKFGAAVIYVAQAHSGAASARNTGAVFARGGLLCFLDADDRLHREKLSRQLEELAHRPEIEFCDAHSAYFWSEELTPNERQKDYRYANPFWREIRPGHISTWLVRRATFERVGPFDPDLSFSEDTDWLLRFRDGGGIASTLTEVLSYRRLHRDNVTARNRRDQIRSLAMVLRNSRDRRQGAAS